MKYAQLLPQQFLSPEIQSLLFQRATKKLPKVAKHAD